MTDYPIGKDVETTRTWLDKEGFPDVFPGWKADAILGLKDEFILTRFSLQDQEKGMMLCGFLNTARTFKEQTGIQHIQNLFKKSLRVTQI